MRMLRVLLQGKRGILWLVDNKKGEGRGSQENNGLLAIVGNSDDGEGIVVWT